VLLLEKQDSIYSEGSSLGEARIARSLGTMGDIFSFLHNESVSEAQHLIEFLNDQDTVAHRMEDLYRTSPVSYVRHRKQMERMLSIMDGQRDSFQFASDPSQGADIFGANFPDSTIMLREYQGYSGTINPQALIAKIHRALSIQGASVRYRTEVQSVHRNGKGFRMDIYDAKEGTSNVLYTHKVVCATGPYTGELLLDLAPYFAELITPQRVFLGFFKINQETYEGLDEVQKERIDRSFPVINSSEGTRYGSFFSMIEKIEKNGSPIFKIGGHFQRKDINDLNAVWQRELALEEVEWGRDRLLKYFQLIDVPLDSADMVHHSGYSCVYSLTPSEVPYVTHLLDETDQPDPNLVVLAGMSGVGAKGAMKYGKLAADLLLDRLAQDTMTMKCYNALGFERLRHDVQAMQGD